MKVYRWTGIDNRTLTYDQFFQLWLNVDDTAAADNFNQAVAGSVAIGNHKLPRQWIAAAVDGESDVSEWRNWDTMRLLNG